MAFGFKGNLLFSCIKPLGLPLRGTKFNEEYHGQPLLAARDDDFELAAKSIGDQLKGPGIGVSGIACNRNHIEADFTIDYFVPQEKNLCGLDDFVLLVRSDG